ncbi:RPM1-interacting protein 4 [Carex littledalei]|uniref:RPM1-interacting protein 4 n=1 Tax=Carex littledalei TaxID=544730 RepID=A0A833R304_9POAL|nr:RPM1-interacting protein 4 [Carex littledalei]
MPSLLSPLVVFSSRVLASLRCSPLSNRCSPLFLALSPSSPLFVDRLKTSLYKADSSMGESSNSNPGVGADAKPFKDQAYLDAVVDKRIKMFQVIQAEQIAERAKIGGEPIKLDMKFGLTLALQPSQYKYLQDKGRPLPKFGEWDVNNPASAEGFTVIFQKARDEKKPATNTVGPATQTIGGNNNGGGIKRDDSYDYSPKAV